MEWRIWPVQIRFVGDADLAAIVAQKHDHLATCHPKTFAKEYCQQVTIVSYQPY